jgi:hypothetical protein
MTTAPVQSAPEKADPENVSTLYKHLRVCDVADALDGIGYFDITLMSPEIRPRKHNATLGLPKDASIDIDAIEAYYAGV